ncbi:IclR family transcriptional regulator [Dactylosporangium sp. CA-233914]|uniref:IclR family transcriptional regulator n=1 Tax=Dactylosporangium sp. CA-233914 TaxID=3239934 RepID=UPI003D8CF483
MTEPPRAVVSSAVKVLRALEIVCASEDVVSLERLASELSVSKPTAFRIMSTLIETGFVRPAGFRTGFVATLKIAELGTRRMSMLNLPEVARPVFRPVAMRFGETVTIAQTDGHEIFIVDKITAGASLVFYCDVGRRLPLHIGASARAVLAQLSDEQFESYVAGDLRPRTAKSHVSAVALRKLRRKALADGYVLSIDEVDIGVSAVAVPIVDATGSVLGAASIANTTRSWTERDHRVRAEAMQAAATKLVAVLTNGTKRRGA